MAECPAHRYFLRIIVTVSDKDIFSIENCPAVSREIQVTRVVFQTIWERWNSLDESGHVSSTGMNSLNHYSYGAILEWIFRHAAGIDVMEQSPGGRVMRISPKVNNGLKYVKAVFLQIRYLIYFYYP